ncbi:MAG: hypothetical protein ACJ8KU_00210 [Chthoniobacterales bacterium]
MRHSFLLGSIAALTFAAPTLTVRAEGLVKSETRFYYKDHTGNVSSAHVIHRYWRVPIVHPFAKIDPRVDMKLVRAASFAQERAHAESKAHCWQYVKQALIASGAVNSYPKTNYACQAGDELVHNYGFRKIPGVHNPYDAPIGAVLVYGEGSNGAGHVELRTKDGFVSDYHSKNRCKYPLIAAYAKFS